MHFQQGFVYRILPLENTEERQVGFRGTTKFVVDHIQMLPQVAANIEKLGFKPRDVKILLNSHAHFDHCGGFAEFKRRTGATVVASKLDGELMMRGGKGDFYWGDDLTYEPVKPDRIISDDERVELGVRPGHRADERPLAVPDEPDLPEPFVLP